MEKSLDSDSRDLRIAGAEGEAAIDEGRGVGAASRVELVDDRVEIGGRGAVADADDC